ncbi:hypothetical protein A3770_09p54070 [Chloropicon primus]|uniref:Uncharacterized protein n=1 Tax=Chloropicon primus TaxID=1764295 RepID=A0A5B8MQS1_9CHLO|nr:hypothetical protein A3770_09p54070 [Chloropicon primus]|eukprot:QDZ22889.1 hypothetical protein A3770_09p54070 [Chloropicon primus]
METPVAVVVTNNGTTWGKALNCYGTDEGDVLRMMHSAASKWSGKRPNGSVQNKVEHASIPSLNARMMATRGKLADGYLYLFTSETNTFALENLMSELLQVRCSAKSAGLTMEDIVKDSEKVVALVEAVLVPHMLHCTRKVLSLDCLTTIEGNQKQNFDLSQEIRPHSLTWSPDEGSETLPEASATMATPVEDPQPGGGMFGGPQPTCTPTDSREDANGAVSPIAEQERETKEVLQEGTNPNLVATVAPQSLSSREGGQAEPPGPSNGAIPEPLISQDQDVRGEDARDPLDFGAAPIGAAPAQTEPGSFPETTITPAAEPADPFDLFGLPPTQDSGALEANFGASDVAEGPSPDSFSQEPAPPFSAEEQVVAEQDHQAGFQPVPAVIPPAMRTGRGLLAGGSNEIRVDSPMTMINTMFRSDDTNRWSGGVKTTAIINERITMKVKAGCLQARCTGSVGIRCDRGTTVSNALIKLNPVWLRDLGALHILAGGTLSQDLVLDCGAAPSYGALQDVIRYSVKPNRFPLPARTFFEIRVAPRWVELHVQLLKSPRMSTSINTASCAIQIPLLHHFSGWQVKHAAPKAMLDSRQSQLAWKANVFECAEGKSFRAVLLKPEGLVNTEDLSALSQLQANVSSQLQYQPMLQPDCQVLKSLELHVEALPTVSVRT